MAITEQDWIDYKGSAARREALTINERLLQVAEVDALHLTGHPEWDRYCQRLQVLANEAKQQMEAYQDALTRAFAEKDHVIALVHYHRAKASYETLLECIALPRHILAEAVKHGAGADSHH